MGVYTIGLKDHASNGAHATPSCASEPTPERTPQRASGQPSCAIRPGVERGQRRESVRRKAQQRKATSTTLYTFVCDKIQMQAVPVARKLLTSVRPPVGVREAGKVLNLQPSSRVLPVQPPKTSFAPSAPRKTAGRKGRKGRGRHLTKGRKVTRRRR